MTDITRVATQYGSGRTSITARHRQVPRVTHELVFNVATDDAAIGTATIADDYRTIKLGDTYVDGLDIDPNSICVGIDVQRDPVAEKVSRVKARFSNEEPELETNPLVKPAVWRPYFETIDWYFPKDQRGQWYRNTADDWLETPPPTKMTVMGFKITRNEASFNVFALASWMESTNTDIWYSCPPGYVRLKSIEPGDPAKAFGVTYYPITYNVQIHPFGWHPWYTPSMGRRYKDSSGKYKLPSADGVFQDQPILLDANGDKLASGQAPYLQAFYPLKERAFFALNL
jgi:hypothetical protein